MILLQLFAYFLICSVLGFCIDTVLRSIRRKRFAPFRKIPFSPLFGLCAFALLKLPAGVEDQGILAVFLYYALVFCTFEYIAGALILKIRGERLWTYQDRHFNLHGHTDLFHFFLWGGVGLACRLWAVGPVAGLVGLNIY